MIKELADIRNTLNECPGTNHKDAVELYPGIELSCFTLTEDNLTVHHAASDHILEIDYCKDGRIGWKMGNGNSIYLGRRDFSLHTLKACADSLISLPGGRYEGLTISIDLRALTNDPPEPLAGTGITGQSLYHKFCRDGSVTSLAGNERTERIFSAFYHPPGPFLLSWQKIKVIELLLYLSELTIDPHDLLTEYRSEQTAVIREIHDRLTTHMEQRFTIEALAKQYFINPTTLKSMFKSIYGSSIAAHLKEHRMERAAELLRETSMNIADIAMCVGYNSQSRFTAAFQSYSGMLPRDYRNKRRNRS